MGINCGLDMHIIHYLHRMSLQVSSTVVIRYYQIFTWLRFPSSNIQLHFQLPEVWMDGMTLHNTGLAKIDGTLRWQIIHHPGILSAALPHWKLNIFMVPTFSALVAPQVVVMTTCGAAGDDKVGIVFPNAEPSLYHIPQYIPWNMHMVFFSCAWIYFSYTSGLLHLYWSNCKIALMPMTWSWGIGVKSTFIKWQQDTTMCELCIAIYWDIL